jgi:CRISPR-associated Cas5-like protein
MHTYLLIRLSALISSFGTEVSPGRRPTGSFPGHASLTGLIGNCLGLDSGNPQDVASLEEMQREMRLASVVLRSGKRFVDYQNAHYWDPAKVTNGDLKAFENRLNSVRPGKFKTAAGMKRFDGDPWSTNTANANKQIRKHYLAGHDVLAAVRFVNDRLPMDYLAQALQTPARMPYIGRKTCLPTEQLFGGLVEAEHGLDALRSKIPGIIFEWDDLDQDHLQAAWDIGEGPDGLGDDDEAFAFKAAPQTVADLRIWDIGRHGGTRRINVGWLRVPVKVSENGHVESNLPAHSRRGTRSHPDPAEWRPPRCHKCRPDDGRPSSGLWPVDAGSLPEAISCQTRFRTWRKRDDPVWIYQPFTG